MILKATTLLGLALCVLGDGHAISEQKIVRHHHHGEIKHVGNKAPEHHEEYAPSYPSYEFSYKVEDPHTHDVKGHTETRKGDEVKGEYWLYEPDGRKRTVKYHSDKHSGFKAHVEYSAPHHHVHLKTHKHEEHKHHVELKHEEHKHEEHKHEEHKHEEHKHEEHKIEEILHKEHKHEEPKHEEVKHKEHKPKIIQIKHVEIKPVHEEHKEHHPHIPALSLHRPRYHKYEQEGYHPKDYRHYQPY